MSGNGIPYVETREIEKEHGYEYEPAGNIGEITLEDYVYKNHDTFCPASYEYHLSVGSASLFFHRGGEGCDYKDDAGVGALTVFLANA